MGNPNLSLIAIPHPAVPPAFLFSPSVRTGAASPRGKRMRLRRLNGTINPNLVQKRGCKITVREKRRIPEMGSSVNFCYAFDLWKTFFGRNVYNNTPPRNCAISWGIFLPLSQGNHAAFCIAIFFRWYLQRLKPQDISPNSKITPSIPLRRSRL